MSHDPKHHHPLGETPASHREIAAPPAKSYPAVPARKAKEAIEAFTHAHRTHFGTASGKTTYHIRVSADPREWFYRASQSTQEKHGPPTPLQILGKDKGPEDRNVVTLTDVVVEACISSHWSENFPAQGWETAVNHYSRRMLVLGARPVPPRAPADATWQIHAVTRIIAGSKYFGSPLIVHCLALGSHSVITDHAGETDALIEHLRKVSQDRLQGTQSVQSWAEAYLSIHTGGKQIGKTIQMQHKINTNPFFISAT